jgi:hypothetical protein
VVEVEAGVEPECADEKGDANAESDAVEVVAHVATRDADVEYETVSVVILVAVLAVAAVAVAAVAIAVVVVEQYAHVEQVEQVERQETPSSYVRPLH